MEGNDRTEARAQPCCVCPKAHLASLSQVSLRALFAGKRGVLFAVPGAFTPTCSKSHLPSFVAAAPKMKEAGVEVVACVATNDEWTMAAWGEAQGATGKVRMLSDASGALTNALGMAMSPGPMVTRSKRYAMIIVDNKIAFLSDASAAGNSECTYAEALMAALPTALAKAKDPLEAFCESDPSADECRVYSD